MTTCTVGATEVIEIRKPLAVSPATGRAKAWTGIELHGVPRLIKRKKSTVTFLLAGRTFIANTADWNGRSKGYIEAVEKR